jgi:hypothetical protein
MKKPTTKRHAPKPKKTAFFLDIIFTNYRKYRNHRRYVHADLL